AQVMDDSNPLFAIDHRPGIFVPHEDRVRVDRDTPSEASPYHPLSEETVNPAEIFLSESALHESAAPIFYDITPQYRETESWVIGKDPTDEIRTTKRQRCAMQGPSSDSCAPRQDAVDRRLHTRGRRPPRLRVDTRWQAKPGRPPAQSAYPKSHSRSGLQRRFNSLSAPPSGN
ncbi:hypothetical protein BJX66DRAFT_320543, partial [Aspergillus keveii]